MDKDKGEKDEQCFEKTLHRKIKIEHHEPNKNRW